MRLVKHKSRKKYITYRIYVKKKIGDSLMLLYGPNVDYVLVPADLFDKLCSAIADVARAYCNDRKVDKCIEMFNICKELEKLRSIYVGENV